MDLIYKRYEESAAESDEGGAVDGGAVHGRVHRRPPTILAPG